MAVIKKTPRHIVGRVKFKITFPKRSGTLICVSKGPGKLQSQLLTSAAESGYVQSNLIEKLFGYRDSSVRRALRTLEARGLIERVGRTETRRNVYKITDKGREQK